MPPCVMLEICSHLKTQTLNIYRNGYQHEGVDSNIIAMTCLGLTCKKLRAFCKANTKQEFGPVRLDASICGCDEDSCTYTSAGWHDGCQKKVYLGDYLRSWCQPTLFWDMKWPRGIVWVGGMFGGEGERRRFITAEELANFMVTRCEDKFTMGRKCRGLIGGVRDLPFSGYSCIGLFGVVRFKVDEDALELEELSKQEMCWLKMLDFEWIAQEDQRELIRKLEKRSRRRPAENGGGSFALQRARRKMESELGPLQIVAEQKRAQVLAEIVSELKREGSGLRKYALGLDG